MVYCPKLTEEQLQELSKFIADKERSGTEIKRAQAVLLIDKDETIDRINLLTGYHRRQTFGLRRKYLKLGVKGIISKRKRRVKELLTRRDLSEIKIIIKEKGSPLKFGYESKFWSTLMLSDFIEKKYKVKYKSRTSYYLIFKRVKFTYHKPGRVWEKQDKEKVRAWKKKERPKIKRAWKNPNVVILCEDEMKLSTQTSFQKIWLPEGEYPKVEVSGTRKSKSIYGFLNLKTGNEHAFVTEWQNMYITKEQLQKIRLIYPKQKLLIIWDGPGSHRGKEVTQFVERDGRIELIFFPPYTPELNPQEHVWKDGRKEVSNNKFIPDVEKIAVDFVNYLNNKTFPYSLLGFSAKS